MKCPNCNSEVGDVSFCPNCGHNIESVRQSNTGTPKKKKSKLIAIVLCACLGTLGIHRFYLDHMGMGVLELLTGGVCGVMTIVDLVMIATGSLKPKDGEYED